MYISIDGDDVGRKITSCYITNNRQMLEKISNDLVKSTNEIATLLVKEGFTVIFCAADGVVATSDKYSDVRGLFKKIQALSPENSTFSAGVGENLRNAYLALLNSKSNGKNTICVFEEISNYDDGM